MSTINDLVEILEEQFTPLEVVELLSGFYEEDLEDYAIKNNICPKCLSQLTIYKWKESRGECFGFPTYEEMSELVCQGCGRVF
jgi:uncharacterized protein with PIN domain